MNEQISEVSLEDVLEGYAVATPDPSDLAALRSWIARYPQYASELMEFAGNRSLFQFLPEPEVSSAEEERFISEGLAFAKRLAAQSTRAAVDESAPVSSIVKAGQQLGLKVIQLAADTGLSVGLVMMLEQRLITFASIPQAVVGRVATALRRSEESVAAYLRQPASMAPNASYKSQSQPKLTSQQEFADAVRDDRVLSAEQKAELLALTRV